MKRAIAILAVATLPLLVAACAPAPTRGATHPATTVPAATAASEAGLSVPLFTPRSALHSSAQPNAGDWPLLAARGVRTVINLRTEGEMQGRAEAAEVHAAGMAYRELPIDGAEGITAENARKLAALLRDADGEVLVHCASANRSGGLLALMAAQVEGMDPEQALAFGRAAGMRGTEARVRQLLGK